ncbi:hypothetical protein INR49_003677 [Caranx melampygus]|nr:hypothetical protein INR49_003677 [Caranx melampygus]
MLETVLHDAAVQHNAPQRKTGIPSCSALQHCVVCRLFAYLAVSVPAALLFIVMSKYKNDTVSRSEVNSRCYSTLKATSCVLAALGRKTQAAVQSQLSVI